MLRTLPSTGRDLSARGEGRKSGALSASWNNLCDARLGRDDGDRKKGSASCAGRGHPRPVLALEQMNVWGMA